MNPSFPAQIHPGGEIFVEPNKLNSDLRVVFDTDGDALTLVRTGNGAHFQIPRARL